MFFVVVFLAQYMSHEFVRENFFCSFRRNRTNLECVAIRMGQRDVPRYRRVFCHVPPFYDETSLTNRYLLGTVCKKLVNVG